MQARESTKPPPSRTAAAQILFSTALGVALSFSAIFVSRRMQNAAHTVWTGLVIEFRQQNCLGNWGKEASWGKWRRVPLFPAKFLSSAVANNRNLPGNIRDKSEIV